MIYFIEISNGTHHVENIASEVAFFIGGSLGDSAEVMRGGPRSIRANLNSRVLTVRIGPSLTLIDLLDVLQRWAIQGRQFSSEITATVSWDDGRIVITWTRGQTVQVATSGSSFEGQNNALAEAVSRVLARWAALSHPSSPGSGMPPAIGANDDPVVSAVPEPPFKHLLRPSEDSGRSPYGASAKDGLTVPVVIYVSNETVHQQVEEAVVTLAATAGLYIHDRDIPIIGSWYRTMTAKIQSVVRSPAAREASHVGIHVLDNRMYLAQDAAITATLMQNLGPLITALQPTKDAAIRVGSLLVVKVDWILSVHQLTAAQQAELDHAPRLLASPHEIFGALHLTPAAEDTSDPTTLT